MNKKKDFLLIALLIVIIVFLSVFFNKGKSFNDLCIADDWDNIIANRTLSNNELVDNIIFNGYNLLYDKSEGKWYYSLIEGDLDSFNPKVKYFSKQKVDLIFKNNINNSIIENNQNIEFIVYTDTEYKTYKLVCTTLPIMNITYNDDEEIIKDATTSMSMYLFDNRKDATNRIINSIGDIRVRGRTTTIFPKKGYKLSLTKNPSGTNIKKNNVSLLGMMQDDDWILYAGYNDQEKIRNVFSCKLWNDSCSQDNSFNVTAGVEYKYIELFLNGKYWGLYALGYQIDEKHLGLNKNNQGYYDEFLFQKSEWRYKTNFDDLSIAYKLDSNNENRELAFKSIKNYYETLVNSNDIDKLYSLTDINNSIDIYLFLKLVQGRDQISRSDINNLYLLIKNNKTMYIPWDLDYTFGNDWDDNGKNKTAPYYIESSNDKYAMNYNVITYLRKLGDTNINELLKKKYNELRNTTWSNNYIESIINKYEKDIYDSGAFNRDKTRWSDGSYNDESVKLSEFKNFVFERLNSMDSYIQEQY